VTMALERFLRRVASEAPRLAFDRFGRPRGPAPAHILAELPRHARELRIHASSRLLARCVLCPRLNHCRAHADALGTWAMEGCPK